MYQVERTGRQGLVSRLGDEDSGMNGWKFNEDSLLGKNCLINPQNGQNEIRKLVKSSDI